MAKSKSIKDQLEEALDQEDLDYDAVLHLAHSLADEDDERIRFSVDASLIERLGRELVAKQETAVAEIVKNAYDADATTTTLTFRDCYEPGGTLEIVDNGHGMTRNEVIAGFMRLSTQDKVDNPESRKYERTRAGRKGIGRFSAQRLGSSLTLLTQTHRAKHALKLSIDWDDYVRHHDLYAISNEIEEIEPFRKGAGTTLIIDGLRDGWTEGQLNRTYRYISELLQPFPLSKKRRTKKGAPPNDPGFKATFVREEEGEQEDVIDDENIFLDHALAIVEGHVDNKGLGYFSVKSSRLDLDYKDQPISPDKSAPKKPYSELRNIHMKAYYFVRDPNYPYPRNLGAIISRALKDHGGIRFYRNGFRVLPYGEEFNDWLRLDASSARRLILPPHANENFFGIVEVHDIDGDSFEETSSREGLVENEIYHELQNFGYKVLTSAASKVAEARGRKTTEKDWVKPLPPMEKAEDLALRLEDLASQETDIQKKKGIEEIAADIQTLGEDSEAHFQEQIDEKAMLRVLAGMGLSIGEFTHEIRFLMDGLEFDLDSLIASLPLKPKQREILRGFSSNLGTLNSYASYFDRTVTDNVHREVIAMELRDVVDNLNASVSSWMLRKGIDLDESFDGYELFACPMHPSEWASILLNLCTNAVKAIDRAEVDGEILISGGEDGDTLFLEFSDNGDGISEEHTDKVFDAFFTTTLPSGPIDDTQTELTGTGLGLKIVRDILRSYDGDIKVVAPPAGFSTCFRIEVPKAQEDEIPEDAY